MCLIIAALVIAGCSEKKKDMLTEVNINDINVPSGFNYENSKQVSINLQGDHRLPVTIQNTSGEVLFRGMMNPSSGLSTKLSLSNVTKKIVLIYHVNEVAVDVTNTINYSFGQSK